MNGGHARETTAASPSNIDVSPPGGCELRPGRGANRWALRVYEPGKLPPGLFLRVRNTDASSQMEPPPAPPDADADNTRAFKQEGATEPSRTKLKEN